MNSQKKALLIAIPLLVVAVFSLSLSQKDNSPKDKDQVLMQLTAYGLRSHFNTQELNDQFSEKAFNEYLQILDPTKRFLTQQDVNTLSQYKLKIDDEMKVGESLLLPTARKIITERVKEAKVLASEVLSQPFDFDIKESYEADPEKRSFPKDKEELKEAWRQGLKYQALVRYRTSMQEQEKKKKDEQKSAEKIEQDVREQLQKTYNNVFDAMEKYDSDDRTSEYINAVASVYDPHTEYFPPADKENFDISMSGKLEGIGAQLLQSDGEIKVTRIVPGSASWKQKELKEGDIILKVAQGEEEPVDVSDMPLKDAVQLIRGEKGSEVRLTVRKSDGVVKVIPIIRDVVILEENYAKSATIKDNNSGREYGYIKLPSFYADFKRKGGRQSAQDVALELKKLKQQGVEGIILDLRNNGGGSLTDAVDMSGLFIEDGPIVQVKTSGGKSRVWEDTDSSVAWDGPLVILVNKFSASASEILSAAMQDYGRAVIVGSSSTFGKGTVQQFLDLDYFLRAEYDQYKPLGSLKLTVQKFYRITGNSTQWKGVVPDVLIPDSYSYMDGEKDMDYALPWDEIKPVDYQKWDKALPLEYIKERSEKRVSKSKAFDLIASNAERLKELRESTVQSLSYAEFNQNQKRLSKEAKKYEGIAIQDNEWAVAVMPSNVENEAMKKEREELNKAWKESITEDAGITEATLIINDLIQKSGS